MPRRRKPGRIDIRRDELRRSRAEAPTLRQSMPAATQVWVGLEFAGISPPAPAARAYTVYPAAQAHFVYACPHGNCDGNYDLNDAINGLLQAGGCNTAGTLSCTGHRSLQLSRTPCGLDVRYTVAISYLAQDAPTAVTT